MDYLLPIFNEYLNDEGEIEIAGYTFLRDAVLHEMENDGYMQAFNEWVQERQYNNLQNAQEILSQFDNEDRFNKLKEIYSRGAVVPFIGAGLSIPSGYPGWTSFLYKMLDETRLIRSDFDDLIKGGLYEEAAQCLFDNLPAGCFTEHVENVFAHKRDLAGVIQKLPFVFTNAVITTNFDTLLQRGYQDNKLDFDEVLLGSEALDLPKILGENKRVLVKLHGKANSSKNRILTKDEYDKHYENEHELEKVIDTISNKTLLFIGCSLSIDRTIKCMKKIVKKHGIEKIPRHYAFLRLNDENERLDRRDFLAEANIHPIWYKDDHDECIEALLEKLLEGANV
jgi:hypothetical protein